MEKARKTRTKIFAAMLAMALALGMMPQTSMNVFAEQEDTSTTTLSGTGLDGVETTSPSALNALAMPLATSVSNGDFLASIDPPDPNAIKIYTAQDLDNIRNNLSGSYVLMKDIDLSSYNGGEWVPIGSSSYSPSFSDTVSFLGTFDGQGHIISNMKITGLGYSENGLFGHIKGATIENVGMINTNITIDTGIQLPMASGTICGLNEGDISNCYNNGNISVSTSNADDSQDACSVDVGGICGTNDGSINYCSNIGNVSVNSASSYLCSTVGGICGIGNFVYDCYNTGDVLVNSFYSYAGGICGGGYTVYSCYNTGNVSANAIYANQNSVPYYAYSGGICGSATVTSRIYNCYNTGVVSALSQDPVHHYRGESHAGGICASTSGTITTCYNVGDISVAPSSAYLYLGGICGNYTIQSTNCYCLDLYGSQSGTQLSSTQMQEQSSYLSWDFDTTWVMLSEFEYPQLRALSLNGTDEGGSSNNNKFIMPISKPDPNAIPIYTAKDLDNIKTNLSGSYVLMNDINLATYNGGEWVAIGDDSNPFTGTFDGQGHIIHNLEILGSNDYQSIIGYMNTKYSYYGLFGYSSSATIKNVGIENVNIQIFGGYGINIIIGGICGYNNGSISNCYTNGALIADFAYYSPAWLSCLGGICGESNGSINNCYNMGDVSNSGSTESTDNPFYQDFATNYTDTGGICGLSSGSINNSFNKGKISANTALVVEAGGIVGKGYTVSNCYNTGDVRVTSIVYTNKGGTLSTVASASGISSSCDSILNCFNTGSIYSWSSNELACGIGGENVYNCYNIGEATVATAYGAGVTNGVAISKGAVNNSYCLNLYGSQNGTQLTSAQMQSESNYIDWDFNTIWEMVPGYAYPQLRDLPSSGPQSTVSTSTLIEFGQPSYSANVGDTINLGVNYSSSTLNPDSTSIIWTCSDPSAVTFGQMSVIGTQASAIIGIPVICGKAGAYTIAVTATDGASAQTTLVINGSATTVPSAPTNVTAIAGDGQATISFTVPSSDGGSPITGYKVIVTPSGMVLTGTSSPITVTGLTNGTAYTFTVIAMNAAGDGVESAASNTVIPTTSTSPTNPTDDNPFSFHEGFLGLDQYYYYNGKPLTKSEYPPIHGNLVISLDSSSNYQALLIPSSVIINVDGNVNLTGDLILQKGASITSQGNFTVSNGILDLSSGDESSNITVGGDFIFDSNIDHTKYLTDGTISVKGNVTIKNGKNFICTDKNKFVFTSGSTHTITPDAGIFSSNVNNSGSFNNIEVNGNIGNLLFKNIFKCNKFTFTNTSPFDINKLNINDFRIEGISTSNKYLYADALMAAYLASSNTLISGFFQKVCNLDFSFSIGSSNVQFVGYDSSGHIANINANVSNLGFANDTGSAYVTINGEQISIAPTINNINDLINKFNTQLEKTKIDAMNDFQNQVISASIFSMLLSQCGLNLQAGTLQSVIDTMDGTQNFISYMSAYYSLKHSEKVMRINCPVDVQVIDNSGNIIGSIVNNIVGDYDDSKIFLSVVGDTKKVTILDGNDYNIKLVATGEGVLNYSISELDDSNIETRRVNFYDIPLQVGTTLIGAIPNAIPDDTSVYALNQMVGNNVIGTVQPNESFTNGDIPQININSQAFNGGICFGDGVYSKGDTVLLQAVPNQGFIFNGWYEDGNKVGDVTNTYSFAAINDRTLQARFIDQNANITVTPTPTPIVYPAYSSGNNFGTSPAQPPTYPQQTLTPSPSSTPTPTLDILLTIGDKVYTKNGIQYTNDVAPYISNDNRTMVPVRLISEALGAKVDWDDATRTVTITQNDKILQIIIDQSLPNGMGTAVIQDSRTFVPIRYISEQLGAAVYWHSDTEIVEIIQ